MRYSAAGIAQRKGKFLVALRNPGGDLGGKWEFPGGKLDPGESPQQCLRREFREELEADIAVGPHLGVTRFYHAGREYELWAYLVTLVSEPLALHEHQRLEWLSREEVAGLDLAQSDRRLLPFLPAHG